MENPMTQPHSNAYQDLINLTLQHGADGMAQVFTQLLNQAMLIERQQAIGAGAYERSEERTAYANGTKPKTLNTPAGVLELNVPKTRPAPGHEHDF